MTIRPQTGPLLRQRWLQALACLLVWCLSFWTLPVPSATADTGPSWTGTWDTIWETGTARLVLVQAGNQVTGRYDFREGVVAGTVSGSQFSGTWTEYDDSGTFAFVLAEDGRSFSGTWNGENVWSGTRTTYFGIPAMTPVWTDYIGTFRIDGMDAQPGDEIAFFDPQGVRCGQYTVVQAGQYGIVRVYGDDPKTTAIDEGATTGDLLTVKIWDSRRMLEIAGPDLALKPGLPPSGSSFLPAPSPPVWQDQQGYALDVDTSTHFGSPVATPYVSNYLGLLTIAGAPAQAGDEVAVFDANGILCGHTRISTPGQYGILQIYGDDPATAGIVEGPTEGGLLTFKVWSRNNGQEYAGTQLTLTSGAALGSFLPSAVPPLWQADPGSVLDIATSSSVLAPPVALDSQAETVQDQSVSGILLRENPGGGPLTFLLGPSLWYFYVQDALFPSATGGLHLTPAVMANAAYSGTKGTLTLTDPETGAFLYTPNPGTWGEDYFVFRIRSGDLLSNYAVLRVAVAPLSGAAPLAATAPRGYAPAAAPQGIADVEAQIVAINQQMTDLTNGQLTPLEGEIADLKASMDEARTFMNKFAERNDWLLKEYAAHKRRLRLYQGQEIQFSMSYIDFFQAKNTWQSSTDPEVRRAQILVMFRYLYGTTREPGQWELDPNTQKDFVDMADIIVRKKAVARIGQALVLLGDLTTELIDAITGIPASLKDAAFQTIQFAAKATIKILPNDTVKALNETCLQYIPYLEFQKARAEALANDINAIRDREEYGGEAGREEALAKARALVAYEQDVLTQLEPEVNAYRTQKAQVEASFAARQAELNAKMQEREALRKTLLQYTQNKIDKEFELKQLQEQQAIADNGGPTNYATGLSASASTSTLAADALTSALLNLPRYAVLNANASYVTQKSDQCSYSEKVGENQYVTHYESFSTKQAFNAPVAQPTWRKVNPSGEADIAGNRVYGVTPGLVPIQTGLSPAFTGESWGDYQHCSQTYLPQGGGEKASNLLNIQVKKVEAALFLPDTYYNQESKGGLTGTLLFDAMAAAAETWGKGIDLFLGGGLQQWNTVAIHYTVLNADGTKTYATRSAPQMKPSGDEQSFEINNRMKVLAQGTLNLHPVLLDKDGVQVPVEAIHPLVVTGNKVEPTADANGVTGLTPTDDIILPVREAATFKVTVQGAADMTRYEVKWRYQIYKTSGWPTGWVDFTRHNGAGVTQFSGSGTTWLSPNPITLSDPTDYNQPFKIEFDIVRKYDNLIVYTGKFEHIRSIVKGKSFYLANRNTGEIYPGSNYFSFRGLATTAPTLTSAQLELRLDLGNGESVLVPFTDLIKGIFSGANSAKNQNLGSIALYERYLSMSLTTLNACGNIDLGMYELKDADVDSLLGQMGIAVEKTANTVMTGIDVNLFRVGYRLVDAGPVYVLKGCAPTSLDRFKVRWTFFDDTTTETAFTRVGLLQESQTPMAKGLKSAEIIHPLGNTAAHVGFLSTSPNPEYPNKVTRENNKYYSVVYEYSYSDTKQAYTGQLTRLTKNDLGGAFDQLELDFQFPTGFPQVFVKTVNDVNGALLPVVQHVAPSGGKGFAFDIVMPSAGNFTLLTVLQAPSFGALAMDGTHVVYTPQAGFNKKDRFVIRIDGKVCNISPDVVYYNLEGEVDYSSAGYPFIRLKHLFTPVYGYGGYALGFSLTNADGQDVTSSIAAPPTKLTVVTAAGGANIGMGGMSLHDRDAFRLGLALPGDISGETTVNAWCYMAYPEFSAHKNQDFAIPPMLILHRLFESFENGVQQIKNIWAASESGELLLHGTSLGYTNLISATDLQNLVFRPQKDYTGPTALFFYGSANGENWTHQMRIGGRVVEGAVGPSLTDLIGILQICVGMPVLPPDAAIVADLDGDGRIGWAEALHLLQRLAGLRP